MTEIKSATLTTGPGWLQNSSSTWPQTIYNMYMSLSNNLAGENADTAAFDMQAKAIIGGCLGSASRKFIKAKKQAYLDEALADTSIDTYNGKFTKRDAALKDVWEQLAAEAVEIYNKKTSGDGYLCKTAVTWIPPGVKVECLPPGFEKPLNEADTW